MCGRFDTTHLFWREIHEQLSSLIPVKTAPVNLEPNDDVRPTTSQLVARREADGWALEKMRWSLVPFWRNGKPLKDTAKGAKDGFNLTTFNCKVENFYRLSDEAEEPKRPATFREAFKARRCIVPASAWYEWTGPMGAKTKHRFARKDGGTIWFAGLWDRCVTPDAGEVRSFTILTGPSAGMLADYHDRAPVILEPAEWDGWLDCEADATELVKAVRPERFEVGWWADASESRVRRSRLMRGQRRRTVASSAMSVFHACTSDGGRSSRQCDGRRRPRHDHERPSELLPIRRAGSVGLVRAA